MFYANMYASRSKSLLVFISIAYHQAARSNLSTQNCKFNHLMHPHHGSAPLISLHHTPPPEPIMYQSSAPSSASPNSVSPPPSPPPISLKSNLHLRPCTLGALKHLPPDYTSEFVDGLLFTRLVIANGNNLHQVIYFALFNFLCPFLYDCSVASGLDIQVKNILLIPDVFIKLALSSSSSSLEYKLRKPVAFELSFVEIAIELTSESTRTVEMDIKWPE